MEIKFFPREAFKNWAYHIKDFETWYLYTFNKENRGFCNYIQAIIDCQNHETWSKNMSLMQWAYGGVKT